MSHWWIESWSLDTRPWRTWCGICLTPGGFALAVFEGDTCLVSETFESLWEAQRVAMHLRGRYGSHHTARKETASHRKNSA